MEEEVRGGEDKVGVGRGVDVVGKWVDRYRGGVLVI